MCAPASSGWSRVVSKPWKYTLSLGLALVVVGLLVVSVLPSLFR
jgi:hypothetical protein